LEDKTGQGRSEKDTPLVTFSLTNGKNARYCGGRTARKRRRKKLSQLAEPESRGDKRGKKRNNLLSHKRRKQP